MTTSVTTAVTVRLPPDVAEFVSERMETLHANRTSVVVEALREQMRRRDIEREISIVREAGGEPYPDLAPQSPEQVAEVWKDLDW